MTSENSGGAGATRRNRLVLVALGVISVVLASLLLLAGTALLGTGAFVSVSDTIAEAEALMEQGEHEQAMELLRSRRLVGHRDAQRLLIDSHLRAGNLHEALERAVHGDAVPEGLVDSICAEAADHVHDAGVDRPTALRIRSLCEDRTDFSTKARIRLDLAAGMQIDDEMAGRLLREVRDIEGEIEPETLEEIESLFLTAAESTTYLPAKERHLRRAFALRHDSQIGERLVRFYFDAWERDLERDPQSSYTWAERIGWAQIEGLEVSEETRELAIERMDEAMARATRDVLLVNYRRGRYVAQDKEDGTYLVDRDAFYFPPGPLAERDPVVDHFLRSRFRLRGGAEDVSIVRNWELCRDPEAPCIIELEDIHRIYLDIPRMQREEE